MIEWYIIKGWWRLSTGGHYVPYGLVVLLTKECDDIGMAYRWDVEIHHHGTGDSPTEHSTIKNCLQNIWV